MSNSMSTFDTVVDVGTLTIEQLIRRYRELKAELTEEKHEFDAREKSFSLLMDEIQNILLAKSNETGVDSFKTSAGTAYKTTKTFVSITDWDSFINYVRENDAFHLLQRRVTKSAAIEEKEENGELPPGLSYSEMFEINVRK